ncbi:nuclease-related domain-containing protein [Nonomuraea polychroma]|uniref:nuclease-related domain-containing protein n=1 Tax=Nonomuraea polychroma TaxID=46176 RepID=UPI003D8C52CD
MVRPAASGAGASARARYRVLWRAGRSRRLLVRLTLSVTAFALVGWLWGWQWGLVAGVIVAAVDTVQRWRAHSPAAAWRKGALGEQATARRLRKLELMAGYTVLHDRALPRSRANLDHLVIGPCGVVLVDSKRWHRDTRISRGNGRLWIGRRPADSVVKATVFEARKVAEVLRAAGWPVQVTTVVAVHGAKLPRWGAMTVAGVTLLRAGRLCGWIRRHPARLDAGQVASLGAVADQLFPPYTPVG